MPAVPAPRAADGAPTPGGVAVPPLPGAGPPPGRWRRRLGLALVGALLVAAFVGGAALATAGWSRPVPSTFDPAALQSGVHTVLVRDYGLPERVSVRCPAGQAVRPGLRFDCAATLGGAPTAVPVVVADQDGRYLVARPDVPR